MTKPIIYDLVDKFVFIFIFFMVKSDEAIRVKHRTLLKNIIKLKPNGPLKKRVHSVFDYRVSAKASRCSGVSVASISSVAFVISSNSR